MEPGRREQIPATRESMLQAPQEAPAYGVERSADNGIEKTIEATPSRAEFTPPAPQVVLPVVNPPVQTGGDAGLAAAPSGNDDIPDIANDDDLIEKEWVDKAKKIIAETKDDPYKREIEISKLQIEYIRRRYGREIGQSEE